MARVVRQLMLEGHTSVTALCKIIFGSTKHRAGVAKAIEKLHEQKVVRVHSFDANGFPCYVMQKVPGHLPDMPAPAWARGNLLGVAGRAPTRWMHKGRLMTAVEIAQETGENIQAVRKRLRKGSVRDTRAAFPSHEVAL